MNAFQSIGLALFSLTVVIERFVLPLPDRLAVGMTLTALVFLTAGLLVGRKKKNNSKKRDESTF